MNKHSKAALKSWQDPDFREKQSKAMSKAALKNWQDIEYQRKQDKARQSLMLTKLKKNGEPRKKYVRVRENSGCFKKGNSSWSKGKTKETNEALMRTSEKLRGRRVGGAFPGKDSCHYKPEIYIMETRYCEHCGEPFQCEKRSKKRFIFGHHAIGERNPTYGKPRSLETREKIKQKSVERWRNSKYRKKMLPLIGGGKKGKRADLGNQFFRSTWEANWARFFECEGIWYEFEPKSFVLQREDGSLFSYIPDFYLADHEWVEVKGYMDKKSKEKIDLFRQQYPEEHLAVHGPEEYIYLKEQYSRVLANWE